MSEFESFLREQLLIEPWRIPIIVIAATGIYIAFLVLVRVFGSRVFAKMTAFDAVVIVMFGAVAGRAIIGHPPTLMAGIIGLTTLIALEAIFGAARKLKGLRNAISGCAQVIMVHGEFINEQMKKSHLSRGDVKATIRRAGIAQLSQIQLMILEPTGEFSIFKEGTAVDPALLKGVAGVEYLYP
ncbi:DUF421 domain-containing protein [Corynebacterium kutscheri]|uniref:DUF421 domain-containing protein n=1 Tax=Corynebacterium kutscheri TaxID=35755 RepID=UPI0037C0CCB7